MTGGRHRSVAGADPGRTGARGQGPSASGDPGLADMLMARTDLGLRLGLLAIIVGICAFFTLRTIPQGEAGNIGSALFISGSNLQNLARQMAVVGILAVGETFVILTAGIDLSVGAILGLSAILVAKMFYPGGFSTPQVILAGLLFGTFAGITNGLLVAWAKIPAFLVTLGAMGLWRGLAYLSSQDVDAPLSAGGEPNAFSTWCAGTTLGIPHIFIVMAAIAVAADLFLRFSRRGGHLYAIGSNAEAARRAGIPVAWLLVAVYAFSGFCAAVAGLLDTGRMSVANGNFGTGTELDAIAAVVLGGASLFGARGTIIGTALGIVLINVLSNGLDLINADPNVQQSVEGVLIVLVVWVDQWRKRRMASA